MYPRTHCRYSLSIDTGCSAVDTSRDAVDLTQIEASIYGCRKLYC